MGEKTELETATCMLGGENPMDASGCIFDLDLLLRRRVQNLTFQNLTFQPTRPLRRNP